MHKTRESLDKQQEALHLVDVKACNFTVKEKGKYVLLQDYVMRTSNSVGTIPRGTILNITQIDEQYHKVIGDELSDWVHWDLPVKPYVP